MTRRECVRRYFPVRSGWFAFTVAIIALLPASRSVSAAGDPWFQPFLDGLRDRGYYDTALDYLTEVENKPATPPAIREVIPYERAQTFLQGAASVRNLQARRSQLDQAEQELNRFLSASPKHALAGRANAARANLQLERAVVDIWDADSDADPAKAMELRQRARSQLETARKMIAPALEQHKKDWKGFPTFIPESDRKQRAAQDAAKERYMKAELDAAKIEYWEAQSYPRESLERKKSFEKAAAAYEAIVQEFRGDVAAEYAKLWQGKCLEEIGDARLSSSLFSEVINGNDAQNAEVAPLRDLALQFRLENLNGEQLHDYAVVVEEADQWLKDHRDRALTDAGLGIRWELCRALETLGEDRNRSEVQRRGDLTSALEHAREVARFGSQNRVVASRMVQRLMTALDRKGGDARDFASAYTSGTALVDEASKLGDAYRAAQAKHDVRALAELTRSLKGVGEQMARLFSQALQLRREGTEPEKVALARLQLAYAYFLQGKYLDSAAVADYALNRDAAAFPEVARKSGALAMSALEAAATTPPTDEKTTEIAWQKQIGERIVSLWPDSEGAQEAHGILARSAWNRQDPLAAAAEWTKISLTAPQYATAQISAGQAYWKQYVDTSLQSSGTPPSADQLREWKNLAVTCLERGIKERESKLGEESATPDDLVIGKLALAQIRNLDGVYRTRDSTRGAIELLTEKPYDVMSAVAAPLDGERPEDPAKAQSVKVAGVAYQQLLRSEIGVKDLEAARKARLELESLAGGSNPQALMEIYVEFGRELQRELDRLAAAGESQRASETRRGFEEFLSDLASHADGQNFSSLLWIAETFAGLAEGTDDKEAARADFERSAELYSKMLTRVKEPGFLPDPAYRALIRLHLAINQRKQRDFATAEESVNALLEANPNAPDVQAEAAQLYLDWGTAEGGSAGQEKLEISIRGQRQPVEIWGWGGVIQRMQRDPRARADATLRKLLIDSRYGLAKSELALGRLLDDDAERDRHLARARHAVFSFVRSTESPSDEDFSRFEGVYQAVLQELGQPESSLPRDPAVLADLPPIDAGGSGKGEASKSETMASGAKPKAQTSVALIATFVGAGALAVIVIVFFSMRQSSQRRRRIVAVTRNSQQP
jgi:hypothetical protein